MVVMAVTGGCGQPSLLTATQVATHLLIAVATAWG